MILSFTRINLHFPLWDLQNGDWWLNPIRDWAKKMLTWDFCQSQSTSGSSLLLEYCSLNLFWYGHWSPSPIVVSLGLYSLFLHHCESTPKSILLFKTFLLRLFGSQTSELGRSPWEKLEVFWGHSDFQPCATAKKFFWFLSLCSGKAWIRCLPFGQNQQMPPEEKKLWKVSSFLFSLSPES